MVESHDVCGQLEGILCHGDKVLAWLILSEFMKAPSNISCHVLVDFINFWT